MSVAPKPTTTKPTPKRLVTTILVALLTLLAAAGVSAQDAPGPISIYANA